MPLVTAKAGRSLNFRSAGYTQRFDTSHNYSKTLWKKVSNRAARGKTTRDDENMAIALKFSWVKVTPACVQSSYEC